MSEIHLITGEYPPQVGGVSAYTRLVALGLAEARENVIVWCPTIDDVCRDPSIQVQPLLGSLSADDLQNAGHKLDQFSKPRRLIVQWVPHAYGYKAMNLQFCLWLWRRSRDEGDSIELMVHEPYLPFRASSLKLSAAATVQRLMTIVLLKAARRVWVSIPAWKDRLQKYALGRQLPFDWLPVPSNIPVIDDPKSIRALREQYCAEGGELIGHFGTHGPEAVSMLKETVPVLLQRNVNASLLLIGKGSEAAREVLTDTLPSLRERISASGAINADCVSKHLSACDLMLQPYSDGVSSRRGSAMAAIAHGLSVVTTVGRLTDSVWLEEKAVALAEADDPAAIIETAHRLLSNADERKSLGKKAGDFYQRYFDLRHTVESLRSSQI